MAPFSRLLAINIATLFVTAESGRILHDNAPDRSAGPRLYLAGCKSGNVVRIRHDVGEETARAIESFAADEHPLCDPDSTPVHLKEYLRLLGSEAPTEHWNAGLIWTFPDRLAYEHKKTLVGSETPEGARLLVRLKEQEMPKVIMALGFKEISDLWAPWYIALHEDEIASIAFSARLGPAGAETGITRFRRFEGMAMRRQQRPDGHRSLRSVDAPCSTARLVQMSPLGESLSHLVSTSWVQA